MTELTRLACTRTFVANRYPSQVDSCQEAVLCFGCSKQVLVGKKCERVGGRGGMGVPKYYCKKCWRQTDLIFSATKEVKTCSKAIFALCLGYGKSPCFLEVAFLSILDPDYPLSKFASSDGADLLECAF